MTSKKKLSPDESGVALGQVRIGNVWVNYEAYASGSTVIEFRGPHPDAVLVAMRLFEKQSTWLPLTREAAAATHAAPPVPPVAASALVAA